MKKQLRDKWVKALRSRKYKQARGRLQAAAFSDPSRTKTGHCCLGVLLDIVDPEGWEDARYGVTGLEKDHRLASVRVGDGSHGQYISAGQARKLGIPAGIQKHLGMLNDKGKSFKEIADAIENLIPIDEGA